MSLVHEAVAQGWSCVLPEGQCLFPCSGFQSKYQQSLDITNHLSWEFLAVKTNKQNLWRRKKYGRWKRRDKEWDTCDQALPLSDLDHFWPLLLFLGVFQSHSSQSLYLHCFFCFSWLHSDDCHSLLLEMSGPWASKVHIRKYFELLVKRC